MYQSAYHRCSFLSFSSLRIDLFQFVKIQFNISHTDVTHTHTPLYSDGLFIATFCMRQSLQTTYVEDFAAVFLRDWAIERGSL